MAQSQSPQKPKRYCSLPDIGNLREWFEKHFGDICEEHDTHYQLKDVCMLHADLKAIYGLFIIKWWVGSIALITYPVWVFIAAYYWYFVD